MNTYNLSRAWFNFCFDNPEKIKPNHTAVYFFAIENCNRLGWKEKFRLPSQMAMEAVGIKSYNTYSKTFNDLIDWGFFTLIERSKNQYSANIIALSYFDKADNKALDKALIKHATKQSESTVQSIDSINKQRNKETIEHFENWWIHYPRKLNKKKAESSYKTALKKTTPEILLTALKKQLPTFSPELDFIPHATTWLNQERWNNPVEEKPTFNPNTHNPCA